MNNKYIKIILTIIAICLVLIAVKFCWPHIHKESVVGALKAWSEK